MKEEKEKKEEGRKKEGRRKEEGRKKEGRRKEEGRRKKRVGKKGKRESAESQINLHKQNDEVFLNLVLEYVPETVYRVSRQYAKTKTPMPIIYVKV
jgi:hypothetical protein